jgi:class 3 adenylate cyclase
MYERVGDLRAFFLVREHFEALTGAVAARGGAVVKTIGDAVMAVFATPADAMRGALDMLAAMRRFNDGVSTPLHLKVGLHRGAAIAVTLNDHVDYFGQTVNAAARIQGVAAADEICFGETVHDDAEVRALLGDAAVRREDVDLKGIAGRVPVYRLTV